MNVTGHEAYYQAYKTQLAEEGMCDHLKFQEIYADKMEITILENQGVLTKEAVDKCMSEAARLVGTCHDGTIVGLMRFWKYGDQLIDLCASEAEEEWKIPPSINRIKRVVTGDWAYEFLRNPETKKQDNVSILTHVLTTPELIEDIKKCDNPEFVEQWLPAISFKSPADRSNFGDYWRTLCNKAQYQLTTKAQQEIRE